MQKSSCGMSVNYLVTYTGRIQPIMMRNHLLIAQGMLWHVIYICHKPVSSGRAGSGFREDPVCESGGRPFGDVESNSACPPSDKGVNCLSALLANMSE
jgi:hypothetical protein